MAGSIHIGTSFYLNVGQKDLAVRNAYLDQTRRASDAVRTSGRKFFVELKNINLVTEDRMEELRPLADMFTMHLQYLNKKGEAGVTLNLVNMEDRKALQEDEAVTRAFGLMDPKLISVHCGFSAEEIGVAPPDGHNYALSPVLSRGEILSRIGGTVNLAALMFERMGYKGPILVENLDYRPAQEGLGTGGAYEHVCDPTFISQVLADNWRAGMLLDIAHSVISGHNSTPKFSALGFAKEMVATGKLWQLHCNAPKWESGEARDMHLPFYRDKEVVSMLDNILALNHEKGTERQPLFVTIEPSFGLMSPEYPSELEGPVLAPVKRLIEIAGR